MSNQGLAFVAIGWLIVFAVAYPAVSSFVARWRSL